MSPKGVVNHYYEHFFEHRPSRLKRLCRAKAARLYINFQLSKKTVLLYVYKHMSNSVIIVLAFGLKIATQTKLIGTLE